MSKAIDTLTASPFDAAPLPSAPSAPPTARPERRAFLNGFMAGTLFAAVCLGALTESLLAVWIRVQGAW